MSSTIKTENLNLSQFQNADVPSWRTDYNSDMKKIDDSYANSISGQQEENDIQNGDYLGFYDVSAEKNRKTLWSNILEKLGSVFSKNSQILSTVEECEASTEESNIAGASAIAELNSSLNTNYIGFINTNKKIATLTEKASSYTATENCWALGLVQSVASESAGARVFIDKNNDNSCIIASAYGQSGAISISIATPLKKGQTIYTRQQGIYDISFYAMD